MTASTPAPSQMPFRCRVRGKQAPADQRRDGDDIGQRHPLRHGAVKMVLPSRKIDGPAAAISATGAWIALDRAATIISMATAVTMAPPP